MLRLHYFNEEQLSKFKKSVDKELKDWSQRWCISSIKFSLVLCQKGTLQSLEQNNDTLMWQLGPSYLTVNSSEFDWECAIFGEEHSLIPDKVLKQEIVTSCQQDFVLRAFAGEKAQLLKVDEKISSHAQFQFVEIMAESRFGTLRVFIPTEVISSFLKERSNYSKYQLTPISDVIHPNVASVSVKLDFGNVGMTEMLGLEPGKIILSSTSFDAFSSASIFGEKVFLGRLGSYKGSRAFVPVEKYINE